MRSSIVEIAGRKIGSEHPPYVVCELSAKLVFRRSLFVVRDVEAGGVLTPADIRSIRPGYGLPPKHLPQVIGRKAARFLARGQPLAWGDLVT